ncbi:MULTISPECIES: AAA family ATPase [unclassified Microbacterium]|uniref:AAA family ATPase n=1 Tax=unclassified Microbacterium TaxID=2609290 RepID=UPI0018E01AB5
MRVVFMCGPAGSGKSTVARRLEGEGFVRLSFDREAWSRGIRRMPLADDVHRDIDAGLQRRLLELVRDGRDVVLDFSFWSRTMRDQWRGLLVPHGVIPETYYLDTDRATCLERLAARTGAHRDDFVLDEATAAAYFDGFEPPSAEEGLLTICSLSS